MGKYDDISPEKMRDELLRFADLLQRMDRDGILLRASPRLLKMLGELRQMLFAFEIRAARHLGGKDLPGVDAEDAASAPGLDEATRIVREALARERELQEELERRLFDVEDDQD